jgi:lipoyl(octanoyl) transferase
VPESLRIIDLGRMPYATAYEEQLRHVAEVQVAREAAATAGTNDAAREVGRLLLVEHDPPVITISRRQGAADHLLASRDTLARMGIELCETDRGGDITYHGPGQLVVYPILDLNLLGLSLHAYMRFLEQVVIDTVGAFGVQAHRDACATGVWVGGETPGGSDAQCGAARSGAKLCAMGVRVKRWVSMHGLALNVTTNLDHFGLIVPCGLVGRPVSSLERLLGDRCPGIEDVKSALTSRFEHGCRNMALARNGGGGVPTAG